MYKVSSNSKQRVLDHGRLADWVTWDNDDTPEQRLDSARLAVRNLDARIAASSGEERRQLGLQKLAVCTEIKNLKKITHHRKIDLSHFIIEIVKERMGRGEFRALLAAAQRRFDQYQASLKNETELSRQQAPAEVGALAARTAGAGS